MIVLRLDDVGMEEDKFDVMHGVITGLKLPCTYAVVPFFLNEGLAHKVNRHAFIECVVHGYRHENHAKSEKSEFSKERSLNEQRQDLQSALLRFVEFLPAHPSHIFVPPWHHFSEATVQVLRELGFTHLSLSSLERDRIEGELAKQFNTSFFQIAYDPTTEDDIHSLLKKVIASAKQGFAGVILHHNLLVDDKAIEQTKIFLRALKRAANAYGIPFKRLSHL